MPRSDDGPLAFGGGGEGAGRRFSDGIGRRKFTPGPFSFSGRGITSSADGPNDCASSDDAIPTRGANRDARVDLRGNEGLFQGWSGKGECRSRAQRERDHRDARKGASRIDEHAMKGGTGRLFTCP
jgi:hypothetical protein